MKRKLKGAYLCEVLRIEYIRQEKGFFDRHFRVALRTLLFLLESSTADHNYGLTVTLELFLDSAYFHMDC